MIRRSVNHGGGAPPADLLVCFPSRSSHLIPKKLMNSPARLIDHTFHHHHHHHRNNNNQLKKLPSTRLTDHSSCDKVKKAATTGCSDDDASEPSSPKVTCAGQIKVRHNRSGSSSSVAAANCKSWQSVMEEIERIHKKSKRDKKKKDGGGGWPGSDALGFKKDVMQFLTCLRNIKLDFRCFGVVPECDLSSDDDEEDEEEEKDDRVKKNIINKSQSDNKFNEEEDHAIMKSEKDSSRSMFSDWFMVVQDVAEESEKLDAPPPPPPPPPNALLLMRCRSAPAKSWLENRAKLIVEQQEKLQEEERDHHNDQQEEDEDEEEEADQEEEAEKGRKKLRDYLLVMEQYDTDFYKLSDDIAKETWVVGSINHPFTRSRSWKR